MVLAVQAALLLLGREVVVDFAVSDRDPALHLSLLQATDGYLIANVLAELTEGVSVMFKDLAEFCQAELVLRGNSFDGPVEGIVVDPDPGLCSELQLDVRQHQAFQHLVLQDGQRRNRRTMLLELIAHTVHLAIQLALRDDVVVHHGDDAIQLGQRPRTAYAAQQAQEQCGHGRGPAPP